MKDKIIFDELDLRNIPTDVKVIRILLPDNFKIVKIENDYFILWK